MPAESVGAPCDPCWLVTQDAQLKSNPERLSTVKSKEAAEITQP